MGWGCGGGGGVCGGGGGCGARRSMGSRAWGDLPNVHAFARHVKVTFVNDGSLDLLPPLVGKNPWDG